MYGITMSGAQQILQRNDPQQTRIHIELDHENDDAAIAQALEQNEYVSRVWLRPSRRNANWEGLCRVIATRGNLVHFTLFDNDNHLPRVPNERIQLILHAIQQNAAVQVVEFCNANLDAADLCSFLNIAVHVVDLTFKRCALTGGDQGARDLAAALQRNTNIATLKMLWIHHFLTPVLESLVSNTCLKYLVIEHDALSEATRNALQGLLESSTASVQHLELNGIYFRAQSFRPVAQGLIKSRTVAEITLCSCSFYDEGSIVALTEILERKQNLRALTFERCSFRSRMPRFLPTLCSALRRPVSHLRHLQLDCYAQSSADFSNQSLSAFLEAVRESKLESFAIGTIGTGYTVDRLQILANAIPAMKIRDLVIQFTFMSIPTERDLMLQTLRQAVKNNFTLQSVKYRFGSRRHFDASDIESLNFYTERNTRLARCVENPETVPKHLWKEAVALAAKAGPTMLFRLLRKIGPEVLPTGRRQKMRNDAVGSDKEVLQLTQDQMDADPEPRRSDPLKGMERLLEPAQSNDYMQRAKAGCPWHAYSERRGQQ